MNYDIVFVRLCCVLMRCVCLNVHDYMLAWLDLIHDRQ